MDKNTATATATLVLEAEDVDTVMGTMEAADDFFSDAPLDAESAVTGKACNIWDPECEACQ